ncbi:MAG: MFS transporter, partial [Candidatus Hermodarchaeota archaeon]
ELIVENKKDEKVFTRQLKIQTFLIGIIFAADFIFAFAESNFLNTYLIHVLNLTELHVAVMVALSATVGLIFLLVWGIISDNTRSKYGRRRPYLLLGGIVSGIAMIIYAFAPDYYWALILDVIIIGIFSNAYFASQRVLVPDIIEPELRGRANGIVQAFANIGVLIAVAIFLISYELFAVDNPRGSGTILTQEGHLFVLGLGGIGFALCGLVGFLFIKEKPVSELPPKKKFFVELKEIMDINEFRKQKEFYKITLAYLVFYIGIGCILPFLFIYIFSLGLTTMELLAAIGLGFPILIVSTIYLGKLADKHGRKKFVPISLIILSIGVSLTIFVRTNTGFNLLLFFIVLPFILVAVLGVRTLFDTWSQDLLPPDKRGKFFGILNIVFTVSQIIGALAAGIVATMFGVDWIFPLGALFFLLSILFFLRVKETLIIK